MKTKSATFAGILAAFVAPSLTFSAGNYARLAGSDLARLRSDVQRAGIDFSTVISAENDKNRDHQAKKTSRQASRDERY